MNTNFFVELIQRLQQASPKFFVKLRIAAGIIGALLLALSIVGQIWPIGLGNIAFGTTTWLSLINSVNSVIATAFAFTWLPVKDVEQPKTDS